LARGARADRAAGKKMPVCAQIGGAAAAAAAAAKSGKTHMVVVKVDERRSPALALTSGARARER